MKNMSVYIILLLSFWGCSDQLPSAPPHQKRYSALTARCPYNNPDSSQIPPLGDSLISLLTEEVENFLVMEEKRLQLYFLSSASLDSVKENYTLLPEYLNVYIDKYYLFADSTVFLIQFLLKDPSSIIGASVLYSCRTQEYVLLDIDDVISIGGEGDADIERLRDFLSDTYITPYELSYLIRKCFFFTKDSRDSFWYHETLNAGAMFKHFSDYNDSLGLSPRKVHYTYLRMSKNLAGFYPLLTKDNDVNICVEVDKLVPNDFRIIRAKSLSKLK